MGTVVALNATHRSLLRALRILDAFSLESPELRVTDLARLTATDKSTVSRLLGVLQEAGYVRRNPVLGTFGPSLKLLLLAEIAKSSFELTREADPVLRSLRQQTRGTVSLRLLDGDELVTIALLESPEPMRVSHPIGGRTPYNFGAYGKAVLAFKDPKEIDAILRRRPPHPFTPRTLTSRPAVFRALAEVRRRGFAFSDEEGLLGARAVAAPVWNHAMEVVGALGASFPKAALGLQSVPRIGAMVCDAAARLSATLGARPPKQEPGRRTAAR